MIVSFNIGSTFKIFLFAQYQQPFYITFLKTICSWLKKEVLFVLMFLIL